MANQTVAVETIASLFNLTPRRVQQLVVEGVLIREDHGGYPLETNVRRFVSSLETRLSQNTARDQREGLKQKLLQLEIGKRDRELITLEESMFVTERMAGAFVTALNGLPARITSDARQRRRIEAITDDIRLRLVDQFNEFRDELKTGSAKKSDN